MNTSSSHITTEVADTRPALYVHDRSAQSLLDAARRQHAGGRSVASPWLALTADDGPAAGIDGRAPAWSDASDRDSGLLLRLAGAVTLTVVALAAASVLLV